MHGMGRVVQAIQAAEDPSHASKPRKVGSTCNLTTSMHGCVHMAYTGVISRCQFSSQHLHPLHVCMSFSTVSGHINHISATICCFAKRSQAWSTTSTSTPASNSAAVAASSRVDPFGIVHGEVCCISERLRHSVSSSIPALKQAAEYFFRCGAGLCFRAAVYRTQEWHNFRSSATPRCYPQHALLGYQT